MSWDRISLSGIIAGVAILVAFLVFSTYATLGFFLSSCCSNGEAMTPALKRRWSRFSLRTLFWMTFAVAMALLACREHRARLEA